MFVLIYYIIVEKFEVWNVFMIYLLLLWWKVVEFGYVGLKFLYDMKLEYYKVIF